MAGTQISARRRAADRMLAKTEARRHKQNRIEHAVQDFFLIQDEASADAAELKTIHEQLASIEKLRAQAAALEARVRDHQARQARSVKELIDIGASQSEIVDLLEIGRTELRRLLAHVPQPTNPVDHHQLRPTQHQSDTAALMDYPDVSGLKESPGDPASSC